jgi:hypothetical protein
LHDNYVSRSAVGSAILWAVATATQCAAWAIAILDPGDWLFAGMLATTACVTAVAAGALVGRVYTLRMCALIRATAGLQRPSGDVHSIR